MLRHRQHRHRRHRGHLPVRRRLQLVDLALEAPHDAEQSHHVQGLGRPLDAREAAHKVIGADEAVPVVQRLEERVQVVDLDLQGAEHRPHVRIHHHRVELVLRDEAVSRAVRLSEHAADLGRVLCLLLALLLDHKCLVRLGRLGGLLDEDRLHDRKHRETNDAPVDHEEDTVLDVHEAEEQPGSRGPIREGDLEHRQHGPPEGSEVEEDGRAICFRVVLVLDERL
mmetsp:Transcript_28795/g.72941  ORF Transcript_28795/g.72941 Transcript_28795/m.72941 type:complete len:225 (+) Transcript_28795:351-1025(+)